MGLFKHIADSVKGSLNNRWLSFFEPDESKRDYLIYRARRRVVPGQPLSTSDLIADGSTYILYDGQCAITVENGVVTDIATEAGEHTFHSSLSASVLGGGKAEDTAKEAVRRLSYGGVSSIRQAIYYVNLKESEKQHLSRMNGILIRMKDPDTGLDTDAVLELSAEYTYRIDDPAVFYQNCAAGSALNFSTFRFEKMLADEIMSAISQTISGMTASDLRLSDTAGLNPELSAAVWEKVNDRTRTQFGTAIVYLIFDSFDISRDIRKITAAAQRAALLKKSAAPESICETAPGTPAATPGDSWICSCGTVNHGAFCTECGKQRL